MLSIEKEDMEKLVLLAIVGVVIVGAIYMFLISPDMEQSKQLKEEIKILKNQLATSEQLIKSIPEMNKSLEVLADNYAHYSNSLPKEVGYSWFLEYVTRLGVKLDIAFESMIPAEKEGLIVFNVGDVTYKEVLILIHLKGAYHLVGEFINKLENEYQFIKVKELEIAANSQDIDKHNVTLLISLITR